MKQSLLTVLGTAMTIAAGRADETTRLRAFFCIAGELNQDCAFDQIFDK